MTYNFFAFLSRMKYIKRWSLMHSVIDENIMEHTNEVAVIAHALAIIKNKYYNGKVNIEKVVLYALYHECAEVITGDLPTPIKYFNREINVAYKDIENKSCEKLLTMLPAELKEEYEKLLLPEQNSEEYIITKLADKLSAYLKCLKELKFGNGEYKKAKSSIEADLKACNREEVNYFLKNIAPTYLKTLDELD